MIKLSDSITFNSKIKNRILIVILMFIAYIQYEYFNAFPYVALALALIFYFPTITKQKNIIIQSEKTIWDKIIDWHYKIVVWFLLLSPILGFMYMTMIADIPKGEAGMFGAIAILAPLLIGWVYGLPIWLVSLGIFTLIRKAKRKNQNTYISNHHG